MTNNLTPHVFGESLVRSVMIDGDPWFVAKDVCAILNIANHRDACSDLDDDEKGVATTDTLGGPQELVTVSEPGLYRLIFRSRKTEARDFQRWVLHEVLPSIRKRGFYGRRELAVTTFVKDLLDMGLDSRDATKLALSNFPPLTPRERQMLDLEAVNQDAAAHPGDPDELWILAYMHSGRTYGIAELMANLPADSRIHKIRSKHGRESALGILLRNLVKLGRLRRIQGTRHATYELCGNVVPMGL